MWTYAIDATSGGLCRTYDSILGHFPSACQVNAGRPALWLTLAIVGAIVIGASIAWNKLRS